MQGHTLCYVSDFQRLQKFVAQLGLRDTGLATSRVENSMQDCLTRLHALDGFGVLAHVDGPKGLEVEMPGAPPHKGDIINHSALLGIELKHATSAISYGVNDPDPVRRGLGRARNNKRRRSRGSGARAELGFPYAGGARPQRRRCE